MLRTLVLTTALALAPFAASAAPWAIDKSHALISFSVNHLGFSTTRGVFENYDATIDFDPDNIAATKVEIVIDAASVNTFFGKRDDHIRNQDFFDVKKHPTMTFTSTKVTKTGDETATVDGNMTILGVTKPVSFSAKLVKMGPHPFDPSKQIAGMEITGEIDRTQFGMKKFAPAIGAVIPFTFDLEMSPAS